MMLPKSREAVAAMSRRRRRHEGGDRGSSGTSTAPPSTRRRLSAGGPPTAAQRARHPVPTWAHQPSMSGGAAAQRHQPGRLPCAAIAKTVTAPPPMPCRMDTVPCSSAGSTGPSHASQHGNTTRPLGSRSSSNPLCHPGGASGRPGPGGVPAADAEQETPAGWLARCQWVARTSWRRTRRSSNVEDSFSCGGDRPGMWGGSAISAFDHPTDR